MVLGEASNVGTSRTQKQQRPLSTHQRTVELAVIEARSMLRLGAAILSGAGVCILQTTGIKYTKCSQTLAICARVGSGKSREISR